MYLLDKVELHLSERW